MTPGAVTVALLLLTSAGQTTPAAGAVRVVVVPLAETDPDRMDALYGGLEAAGARPVADAARRGIDRPVDPTADEHIPLDEPRSALLAAKAAMRALDLDRVDAELTRALASLLRVESPSNQRDLLADILLLRAEVALARERTDEAEHDLLLLARADPTRSELHPGLHPPSLVTAFARVRAESASADEGILVVLPDNAHPDAIVSVDGEPRELEDGRANLTLPAGPHLVTVRAAGRVGYAEILDVDPGEPRFIEVFLPPPGADAARAAALARLVAVHDDQEALATLCALTGADVALLVGADDMRVWPVAGGLATLAAAPHADPFTVGRSFMTALRPPVTTTTTIPPPAIEVPPAGDDGAEESPSLLGPILITSGVVLSISVVATAIGVTAVLLTQSQAPATVPRGIAVGGWSPPG